MASAAKFIDELKLVKAARQRADRGFTHLRGRAGAARLAHTESGIKARDVYAIDDSGKIWFHASYMQLPS